MSTSPVRSLDRREFLALGLGAFVVASVPFAARRRDRLVRRTLPVMGTLAEVAVVHEDMRVANAAIDAAMQALADVERTMTRFTPTSDIGRANISAFTGIITVSSATAFVVDEALRWAETSGGAYDPAVGGAVALWDVTHRHAPPAAEQVARFASRRLYRAVEVGVHRGDSVIRFHDRDVRLDLGAIAKGYGVDRAVNVLRQRGIRHALVNVGGDLFALGTSPNGEAWRVGIQDPNDDRALIGTVDVSDAAVATSGTYLQFFRYRGARYHHLIDPATAAPRATSVQSLTVKADACVHADVAATALYGMPNADAHRVLSLRSPGAEVVRLA